MAKKRGAGQPPFVPTDHQKGMVLGMALWNIPHEKMRLRILNAYGKPICLNVFKKAFKDELEKANVDVESSIAAAMYKRSLGAKGHNDGKFLLKCKFGWSEEARPPDEVWAIIGGLPDISSPYPEEPPAEEAPVDQEPDKADDHAVN